MSKIGDHAVHPEKPDDEEEEERCDHCGFLPGEGACYYCKMD